MTNKNITWCVAHTQPMKELVAKQHLLDQGYEVYLPRFKKIRRHARKVDEVLAPLFPRYIFIGMDLQTDGFRSINGTRGVSYVLMADNLSPSHIPSSVIHNLRLQEISEGVVPVSSLFTFTKGENIRILEGVFKDQMATFETLDDKNRVQLLLNFMGRDIKMALPTHAVEAA